jgi:hypothetical protein
MAVSAWRTSSSLKGLMIATTSFMVSPSVPQASGPLGAAPYANLASFRANGTKKLQR